MVTVKDAFNKFSKHNPIIATTYGFDFQTIKEMISPRGGIRERSIIITDKDCFAAKDHFSSFLGQGLSYYVYPAYNIKGSFHAKVAIGLDEGTLKLLVGSHNLTENGAKYNLEITGFYEIPLLEVHAEVIKEISIFLNHLSNCIKSDTTIKKTVLHLLNCIQDLSSVDMALKPKDTFFFLHSFEKPIFQQIVERVPKIDHTTICAPFLSEDRDFIRDVVYSFGNKATFLIDPKNFSISDDAKEIYKKHNVQVLNIEGGRHLHAKLFVFHTQDGDWTLFGSPNFTRRALWDSAKGKGNVEAAILLPPSKRWQWKELFQDTVSTTSIQWSELQSVGRDDQQFPSKETAIERWGYETPSNEGVILAQGLPEGAIVYVRLFGVQKVLRVRVSHGMIRFRIPSNWLEDTRYEVLNELGKVIASGFLNRSGASMKELSGIDIDDEAKLTLWFYLRRLHNYESKISYAPEDVTVPEVLLDPRIWIPGPIASNWRPISKEILITTPEKIYKKATTRFERAWDDYYEDTKISVSAKVRQLLAAMDIYVEGAFYAYLVSGGRNKYLVFSARDLSEFFDLPCMLNPMSQWNEDTWKENFCLKKKVAYDWGKYGSKLCIDVSLLFNFWLYLNSKSVGYQAFNRRALDVPIVTNRYYQTFRALRTLIPRRIDASLKRVWDSRISFLKTNENVQVPPNLKDLEECLNRSYELARAKL